MAASANYTEEYFNVYWKIKNFSFFNETITSPRFEKDSFVYILRLHPTSTDIECKFLIFPDYNESVNERQISFLTCDGSPEESISGKKGTSLRVPRDVIFKNRVSSFLPEDTLTVRFRSSSFSRKGNLFISSQIGVQRYYFLWTFENFSSYQSGPSKYLEKSDIYCNINLNLKAVNTTGERFHIEISRTGGEKCYCFVKVSVMDVDGNAIKEEKDEFLFAKTDSSQIKIFPFPYEKSKLLVCKSLLLPNDTLTLKCNFAISLGKIAENSSVISYCENKSDIWKEFDNFLVTREKNDVHFVSELQVDLQSLLKDDTLYDVNLQMGTEFIRCHKIILSARSPVFKAMFTKNMKEAINNTVLIEDLDVETVRRLIRYVYTDTISDYQWENIHKLYSAADKYQILGLKKKCSSFLGGNLSVSNVCSALVVAHLHEDAELKTAVINFITGHNDEVFATTEWQEFEESQPSLACKILRNVHQEYKLIN